jgi:hypothetical protein
MNKKGLQFYTKFLATIARIVKDQMSMFSSIDQNALYLRKKGRNICILKFDYVLPIHHGTYGNTPVCWPKAVFKIIATNNFVTVCGDWCGLEMISLTSLEFRSLKILSPQDPLLRHHYAFEDPEYFNKPPKRIRKRRT